MPLPLAPLYAALELDPHDLAGLCARTGINRVNVASWRQRGGIPVFSADRAAIAAGLHPAEVWDDWLAVEAAVGL